MPDVFISYSQQDKSHADLRGLEGILRAVTPKLAIWRDDRISAGANWSEDISANLREAKSVVVIWSKNSWNSAWVRQEAFYAYMRRVLIPLRVDDVVLEPPFNSVQCAPNNPKGWNAVIDAIRAKVTTA